MTEEKKHIGHKFVSIIEKLAIIAVVVWVFDAYLTRYQMKPVETPSKGLELVNAPERL